MEEMHYFKETQRERIPAPDFQEEVTAKLLLEFLCSLCEWTHIRPVIRSNIEKTSQNLYAWFCDTAFCTQDFWQTFGGYLIVLHQKWQIDIFGAELYTQETVELSIEQQNNLFFAIQKTVSGQYADSISSLCLRIQRLDKKEAARIELLCKSTDWKRGLLVAGWEACESMEQEKIQWLQQNSYYCYGYLSDVPEQGNYLDALSFSQKRSLWMGLLENGLDHTEFEWLYDKIINRDLNNRTEWELALYSALKHLNYTLKISESEFELYDGKGERCYVNFNSEQYSQKVFLKMLFPVNL